MEDFRDTDGKYCKGMNRNNEPLDVKINRMYSLEKSWKKRDDYIADIVNEHPRIYNSWRSFMFTEKGKAAGHDSQWDNFRTFYNDVSTTYKDGLVFRRLCTTKPHSKDNFIWVTNEEAALLNSDLVWIEYEGKNMTLKQWAVEAGSSLAAIKNRYHRRGKKDFTIKEIIYGRRKKRGSKIAKDISEVKSIRAKASKMISSYKVKDFKNGTDICDIDIDWMVANVLTQKCFYCEDVRRVGCDRVDNSKGHTKSNVVPCCFDCNCARGDNFSQEEMVIIGKAIKQIKNERAKS